MIVTRAFSGRTGPWGQLEYKRIAISVPVELLAEDTAPGAPRWVFPGMSREEARQVLLGAGLKAHTVAQLAAAPWETHAEGVALSPPTDLVLDLDPNARAHLYRTLGRHKENVLQHFPEIFYPEFLQERIEASGLRPTTLDLFQRVLYRSSGWLLFSDLDVVLERLSDQQERLRFLQMLHRKVTFLVSLKIDAGSDLDALTTYWHYPGRAKGLRVLFESLARVPGGGSLDLAHLLPPFARKRIYTFPEPLNESATKGRDCIWTSLNFFNDQADDRLSDPDEAGRALQAEYEPVTTPAFGDLILLTDGQGKVVHMAVHVAEDLAFTKNGHSLSQPWIFMKLDTLTNAYNAVRPSDDALRVQFMRRRRP